MFDCGVNYLWVAIVCGCGMAPPSNALPSGQLTCTENEHHSQTLRGVYSTASNCKQLLILQSTLGGGGGEG